MRSTRVHQHVNASRSRVYRLLLDRGAIARWKVPDGMTAEIHELEPREGGRIRDQPTGTGKTTTHTDTYHGEFIRLVPNELVVEIDRFETTDPTLGGDMMSTIMLSDAADGGTEVIGVHEGIPPGVSLADNETGWRLALARLATLAEHG